jgi:hypothetical protein
VTSTIVDALQGFTVAQLAISWYHIGKTGANDGCVDLDNSGYSRNDELFCLISELSRARVGIDILVKLVLPSLYMIPLEIVRRRLAAKALRRISIDTVYCRDLTTPTCYLRGKQHRHRFFSTSMCVALRSRGLGVQVWQSQYSSLRLSYRGKRG